MSAFRWWTYGTLFLALFFLADATSPQAWAAGAGFLACAVGHWLRIRLEARASKVVVELLNESARRRGS